MQPTVSKLDKHLNRTDILKLMEKIKDVYYSLWLSASQQAEPVLNTLITELREQYPGPIFASHVTLVAKIKMELALLQKIVHDLATDTYPFSLPITGIRSGETYTQCVFLTLEATPALLHLRHLALERCQLLIEDRSFSPHHSLAYGFFSLLEKQAMLQRVKDASYPKDFPAASLQIAQTTEYSDGTFKWEVLATFPLGKTD